MSKFVPIISLRYFGTVGLFGEAPNNRFLRKSDLVIVVGNRLTEDDTANFKYPDPRKQDLVQIDVEAAEIGLSYHPLGIVGDPQSALAQIIEQLRATGVTRGDAAPVLSERRAALDKLRNATGRYWKKEHRRWQDADPIQPPRVLQAIARALGPHDYLVTDASASSRWIGPYFPVRGLGRKIITPRGVGPTGFGVGALIGTCLATRAARSGATAPRVVLFSGDGGLVNGGITEFETIQRLGLDCTIVVINNAALGFVKFGQKILFRGRTYQTDRPATDFARLAEAFGGRGTRVDQVTGLDQAVSDAVHADGFTLVDVDVDPVALLPPNFY